MQLARTSSILAGGVGTDETRFLSLSFAGDAIWEALDCIIIVDRHNPSAIYRSVLKSVDTSSGGLLPFLTTLWLLH